MGATIYFDNLQSGEVTQLLNTMGHHTVGLKLHRKGDRSPEPGQTWTHEVFSSRSSEVVLVSASAAFLCPEFPLAMPTCWPLPEPCACLPDLSCGDFPYFLSCAFSDEPVCVFLFVSGVRLMLPRKSPVRLFRAPQRGEPTHAVWS